MLGSAENLKLDKHPITNEASYLQNLIRLLNEMFGITYFAYGKTFKDKTYLFLTTTPLATEIFIKEKFYKLAFCGDITKYHSCNILDIHLHSCSPIIQPLFQAEKEYCHLGNELCMIRKHENYVEFFFFGSTPENYFINNVYLNNIEIFETFIRHFKLTAKRSIKKADQQRITYPEEAGDQTILISDEIQKLKINLNRLSYYPNILQPNFPELKNILTSKELEVSSYVIFGLSAKEIAKEMEISHRTVEKHIDHLKEKLNCKNQKKLISNLLHLKD